ncbi:MAG: UDP-3-O-(3-hydroxymyristoyl)glucosamine N-acyltransferase [Rickettsiales bacterium]|nr:UDP-3-O-(3-hydroxymyristoyl)glucosamine N-acyltransferase [Rickettsiales bacterium]OUW04476.1 MAG: hypothetical protein CBD16_02180 [Betaproteobacteria bacterium TMED156]
MPKNEMKAYELVSSIGGKLYGDSSLVIKEFNSLENSSYEDASFVNNKIPKDKIIESKASLIVISDKNQFLDEIIKNRISRNLTTISYYDPYLFFARASLLLNKKTIENKKKIDSSSIIDQSVIINDGVQIGPKCIIEKNVTIGRNSYISASTFIGENSIIGPNCFFHPRTTILSNVFIGKEVIVHSGAVIGSDGFGYALNKNQEWEKIPQSGNVKIGDNVEIGSNTTIDKGTFNSTVIGSGVKLDSQVHIAHNVLIGSNTAIAGCVGIAGSAKIGERCQIGGASGVLGHLTISDDTVIGPMSLVISDIKKPDKYVGIYPLQTHTDWRRTSVIIKKLKTIKNKLFIAKKNEH